MHGTDEHHHMPQSFLDDPEAWDAFVGRVWAAVLAAMRLPADGVAIEIAPGSSAKIAHALAELGFCGTLHVVEACPRAIDIAAAKYRRLLPQAQLHFHGATLQDALPRLPQSADALLGSHILDDMLLHAADGGASAAATRYGAEIAPATLDGWTLLAADPERLAQAERRVMEDTAGMQRRLSPQAVVLSQYPSATLADGGLGALNDAAGRLLDDLKAALAKTHDAHQTTQALGSLPHYCNVHIGTRVLNPEYWLACRRKT